MKRRYISGSGDGVFLPPLLSKYNACVDRLRCMLVPLLCAALVCFTSCSTSDEGPNALGISKGEVQLRLQVPLDFTTRAATLDTYDERTIRDVTVLVFSPDGELKNVARATNVGVSGDVSTANVKLYTDELSDLSSVDLWVLSNVKSKIPDDALDQWKSKADVRSALTFSESDGVTQVGVTDPVSIPMFGELRDVKITSDGIEYKGKTTVDLLRLVSKIDVEIVGVAQSNVKLQSVYLYNRNTVGQLIPDAENLSSTGSEVIAPSIPSSAGIESKGLPYELPVAALSYTNSIYAFESLYDATSPDSAPVLVLGLLLDGSASPSYYRVDFATVSEVSGVSTPEYLSLLREYRYVVSVKRVNGAGASSASDALKSSSSNLETTVDPVSGASHVSTDGTYILSSSRAGLSFGAEEGGDTLTFYTTYPDGWSLSYAPGDDAWLKIYSIDSAGILSDSPSYAFSGASGSYTKLYFLADKLEGSTEGAGPRSLALKVKAGKNLSLDVLITQSNESQLSVKLSKQTLTFNKTPGVSQTVSVTTVPADLAVTITEVSSSSVGGLEWLPGYGLVLGEGSAITELKLWPAVKSDGGTSVRRYAFSVTSDGYTSTDTLTVNQLSSDLGFAIGSATPLPSLYDVWGTSAATGYESFDVRSTASWWLVLAENPSNFVELHPDVEPSGRAAGEYAGLPLFRVSKNTGYESRTAIIRVVSDEPMWKETSLRITQAGTAPEIKLSSDILSLPSAGLSLLSFTSNASWRYSVDADFATIVGLVTDPEDAQIGKEVIQEYESGADATVWLNKSLNLYPSEIERTKLPAAGVLSSVLTLEPLYPGVVTREVGKSASVTITRDIPAVWDFPEIKALVSPNSLTPVDIPVGGILPSDAGAIRITGKTNASWSVSSNPSLDTNDGASRAASPYSESNPVTLLLGAVPIESRVIELSITSSVTSSVVDTSVTYVQLSSEDAAKGYTTYLKVNRKSATELEFITTYALTYQVYKIDAGGTPTLMVPGVVNHLLTVDPSATYEVRLPATILSFGDPSLPPGFLTFVPE